MDPEEALKVNAAKAAIGTSAGVASSFLNTPTPHLAHQGVVNATAHGGRVRLTRCVTACAMGPQWAGQSALAPQLSARWLLAA
jgi:hypothetical protein